jgi:glyoxylase-like metal-dependent hydrolase (beta-lactamase superfamily II)
VDPPITRAQTAALADWIEGHGKTLEYVYITHWHGDHWLGASTLLRRFPSATVLASPKTRGRIQDSIAQGSVPALWPTLFPGQIAPDAAGITIEPASADGFEIDGNRLLPVEAGHSDTDDTTVLHVPSLELVVAGDVVYNNVHQYLAEIGNGGLEGWHAALDIVAALKPRIVVAGHKDSSRPDAPSDIEDTHRYLDTVFGLLASRPSRREFFFNALKLYPARVNPYTLWLTGARLLEE